MAAPVLDQLADEGKDKYEIVKVDVDNNREVAMKYGVSSIPTVILFKDGEELDRQIGYGGKQGYQALLGKVVV
jgi:thioredoxin 1